MKKACVLLAPGFEEIEAITVIDVLRRAEIETTIVGVDATEIEGAHGIRLAADRDLTDAADDSWDAVILPGGMPGSANLRDHAGVQALIQRQHARGELVAAICAAPIALARAGVLEGRTVTSYPSFADQLGAVTYKEEPVVTDGHVVTSRGPGTALAFALALVARLTDVATADRLRQAMLVSAA